MNLPLALSDVGLFVGEALAKGLVAVAVAAGIAWGLRRRSAALRHAVWIAAFAVLIVLPLGGAVLPGWSPVELSVPPEPTDSRTTVPAEGPVALDAKRRNSLSRREPLPLGAFETTPQAPSPDSAPPSTAQSGAEPAAPSSSEPASSDAKTLAMKDPAPSASSVEGDGGPSVWAFVSDLSARRLALWAALFWGGGACLLLGRLLAGAIRAYWLVGTGEEKRGAAWQDLLDRLQDDLGLDTSPRLVVSAEVDVPMTVGGWRPVLLLPATAEEWSESRRRFALLHELAHVQRRDHLTHLLTEGARALHWLNPMVWWAARRCRAERERACDSRVLAAGVSGPDYAEALVDFAREFLSSRSTPSASLAMARPSTLKTRVRHVLSDPDDSSVPARRWAALAAVALCGAMLLGAFRLWPGPEASGAAAPGSSDTTDVPRELAQSLLYAETTDLSVGELPEGLPSDFVLPDNVQILGGQALEEPYGSITVIATTPQPPEETMDRYERLLARQGWSKRQKESPISGFRPPREHGRTTYCRTNSVLSISAPPRGREGAYLNVRYRELNQNACNEGRSRNASRERPSPRLPPPEGTSVENYAKRYSGSDTELMIYTAEVSTELTLSELVDHYAGELEQEGWTMIDQNDGARVIRQSWQFEDDSGEQWSGIFFASQVPKSSKQSLIFYISKP